MKLSIPSSISIETKYFIRSFFLTCLIVLPLMAFYGWFNMVVRLGLPLRPEVLMGPLVLGLLMSLTVSLINTINFKKTYAIEQSKLKELNETQIEIILTLSEAAESRCEETGAHIKRVAEYSALLGKLAGLSEDDVFLIKNASPLHDIGKIATPDGILLKPGKLTTEEFSIMKEHTEIGYRILSDSTKPILKAAATVARSHHEKWDGSGYPQQLNGEEIPVFGRIVAIADVFDALAHDRTYKKAWSVAKIREYFEDQSGKHFDPMLAQLFLKNFEEFENIAKRYSNSIHHKGTPKKP